MGARRRARSPASASPTSRRRASATSCSCSSPTSASRSSPARARRRSSRPSRCPTSTCRSRAIVHAVNDALVDAPELVNQDPYGAGWILEVDAGRPDRARRPDGRRRLPRARRRGLTGPTAMRRREIETLRLRSRSSRRCGARSGPGTLTAWFVLVVDTRISRKPGSARRAARRSRPPPTRAR